MVGWTDLQQGGVGEESGEIVRALPSRGLISGARDMRCTFMQEVCAWPPPGRRLG